MQQNKKIEFIDLRMRFKEERNEIMHCIENVLNKGSLILGEEALEFESDIKSFTKAKYCIGLNSGTDALMLSLWASGIKKGDEVITSPVSFFATVGAIKHVGATPIFADVGDDGLLDPNKIEDKITSKTKAIMPVHWGGKMCDVLSIKKICDDNNITLIEDSAQSMGAYFNDIHGGRFGITGSFSCHPLKNLNALGDAGFLITDDPEIDRKVRLYRNHGMESRDKVVMYGVNSRLDVLHSEVLRFRLTKLFSQIEKRRKNANIYRSIIDNNFVHIPKEKYGYKDSYVMFLVYAEKRDELKSYLDKKNIESLVYYGTPLHLHEATKDLGYCLGDFPIAEYQCNKVLALPVHQHLNESQIKYVAHEINNFYKNY